nr:uncharacterized protein LOC117277828 [Nicotiana tomentosiformis]
MDEDNDRGWMERFVAFATSDIIPTTASSFPVAWNRSLDVPEEDVLADPTDAARLLQEALTRTGISGPASGTNVSSQSPRPENKKPKRRHNAKSRSRAPIVVPGTVRHSTGSLPSSVDEHPTSNAAFDVAVSHSSTPSTSSPPSPTPATATSLPSSSTLLPATSSPSAAPDHEEGIPPPQSPIHGTLGQNYAAPSEDQQRRRSVTLSISTGCNLLSRLVDLANYLKPLASEKDWEKIQILSGECLLNNAMHNAAADKLLAERDKTVLRLSELETKATEAVVLEARLQQSEQEVLELAAKNGLSVQSDAPCTSDFGFEFSETEEGSEGDDAEDQAGENVEPSLEPYTTPGDADTSLPPDSGDVAV